MTTLFRRLQPAKKFHITIGAIALRAPAKLIARLLKIPKYLIVRVECWEYVIFVHRTDKGGQFISYRRLQHWLKDKSLSNSKLHHLPTIAAIMACN